MWMVRFTRHPTHQFILITPAAYWSSHPSDALAFNVFLSALVGYCQLPVWLSTAFLQYEGSTLRLCESIAGRWRLLPCRRTLSSWLYEEPYRSLKPPENSPRLVSLLCGNVRLMLMGVLADLAIEVDCSSVGSATWFNDRTTISFPPSAVLYLNVPTSVTWILLSKLPLTIGLPLCCHGPSLWQAAVTRQPAARQSDAFLNRQRCL